MYNQALEGTVISALSYIQSGDQLPLEVNTFPDIPIAEMKFEASVGSNQLPITTYVINYTSQGISSEFDIYIPLQQIFNYIAQAIPNAAILGNYISSASLQLTSTDKLVSDFDNGDFAGGQSISWSNAGSQTVSVSFEGHDQSPILGMAVISTQSWQVTLSAVIDGHNFPISSYPAPITFNSPSHDLFQWEQVVGESQYSQTQGSGWYLSGSSATLTLGSVTVDISPGTREQFVGWQGLDIGNDLGSEPSITVTANLPITETAQWVGQYSLQIQFQRWLSQRRRVRRLV